MQLLRKGKGNTIMMANNTTEPEQKMLPRPTLSLSQHRSVSARVLREFLNDVGVRSERFSEIGTDGQRLPSDQWN